MGLKGYKLWVMGQLDSNVQSPTTALPIHPPKLKNHRTQNCQCVAGQVALQSKGLKPGVETRRFQAMGQHWIQLVQGPHQLAVEMALVR
jgi:hypothetical protein